MRDLLIVPDTSPRCAGCLIVSGTFRGDATPPDYRLRATLLGWSSDSVLLTSRGEYDVYVGTLTLLPGALWLSSCLPFTGCAGTVCFRYLVALLQSSGMPEPRIEWAVQVRSCAACVGARHPPLCLQRHVRLNTRALLVARGFPQIGGSAGEWMSSSGLTAHVADRRGAGVVLAVRLECVASRVAAHRRVYCTP